MLTVEQNEELTRVGPGTRMGELLRRYWYPIAFEQDFDTKPSKSVRLLGENWTLHWLDGADHSFHVLKSSGRTDADVMKEVDSAVATWLEQTIGV